MVMPAGAAVRVIEQPRIRPVNPVAAVETAAARFDVGQLERIDRGLGHGGHSQAHQYREHSRQRRVPVHNPHKALLPISNCLDFDLARFSGKSTRTV
jgi:hypothetical protein